MTPPPNPNVVINHLNQTRHRMSDGIHPGLFDNPKEINNAEYWNLSDLHNIPQIEIRITPYNPIDPQLVTVICDSKKSLTYSNHVVTFLGEYPKRLSQHMRAPNFNARLSRYACWRIACELQSNPIVIAYFICPNATSAEITNVADTISRIQLRKQTAKAEQQIGGILHRTHQRFDTFYRTINTAFFNISDINLIKSRNNIDPKPQDPISNYLGPQTLQERLNALHTIIALYNRNGGHINIIADAAMRVARRNLINRHNITPEKDIMPQHIKQIESQYNKQQREFIKTYINESVR